MKLSKYDIGGEIIAILTRGMYPDPRDALREYVQNGIDAKAKNINVKIRQDSIIIEDDGFGMDYDTLRKAMRVGISDKNPNTDVGFMGIGIYSSYHLCDELAIYSRKNNNDPYAMVIDFHYMRQVLSKQREKRQKDEITSEELIDLQTLLSKAISLKKISSDSFPSTGTTIELLGLDPLFF